ncbi:type VII secretion system-associated protein [Streptomyces chartreusis]|uniref:type VII secretion system-associated protein n=1 Tax=Streptomyces chartreusis TaxID=1969 RepID=UPI003819D675
MAQPNQEQDQMEAAFERLGSGGDAVASGSRGAPAGEHSSEPPREALRMPPPEPPADIQEAARHAPDHWIGMVDPAWKADGPPPEWAVVGWWRSGGNGTIEAWRENRDYRPSPQALGWPAPTDPVDAAVQLASTGYGSVQDVHRSLAVAEVAYLVHSDGTPVCGAAPDQTAVLPVFTAPPHIEAAGRLLFEVRPVVDVVKQIPLGHQLYINPTGVVSMLVETEILLSELDAGDATNASEAAVAQDSTHAPVEASARDSTNDKDASAVPYDGLEPESRM